MSSDGPDAGAAAPTAPPALLVDTPVGARFRFEPDDGIVWFGRHRSNPIVLVDSDGQDIMHLNSYVGCFEWSTNHGWQIINPPLVGSRHPIVIHTPARRIVSEPGTSAILPTVGRIEVGPEVGGRRYTFSYRVDGPPTSIIDSSPKRGGSTVTAHLSERTRDYLTVLAEPELLQSPSMRRRTVEEVAALWDVTPASVYKALNVARDELIGAGLLAVEVADQPRVNPELVVRAAWRAALLTADELQWIDPDGRRFSLEARPPSTEQ